MPSTKAKVRAERRKRQPEPPASLHKPRSFPLLFVASFVSGFAMLAYETIWIRVAGIRIGNTVVSAALVIATFFVLAAIGNRLGAWAARRFSPVRAFGIAELACATSACALYLVEPQLANGILGTGRAALTTHAMYVAALAGLPSLCSGAALPLAAEAVVESLSKRTVSGGNLYASNLVGAACGVLVGGLLMPVALGNARAVMIAAGVEVALALVVIASAKRGSAMVDAEAMEPGDAASGPQWLGPLIVIGSGALSVCTEIVVFDYARQVVQDSVYTMTATLFSFILALGLGSLTASAIRRRGGDPRVTMTRALFVSGLALAASVPVASLLIKSAIRPPGDSLLDYAVTVTVASVALLLPLLVPIGTVFPLAWELGERSLRHHGAAIGRMSSANKVACAVGALAAPFLLIAYLGVNGAMAAASTGYLLLAMVCALAWKRWREAAGVTVVGIGAIVGALAWFPHVPTVLNAGETRLATYEGPAGVVAVTRDAVGSHHIVVNQTYTLNGTERALVSQRQESWLPLLLTPDPKRVAFIGMASGVSADAALDFPISHLDAIELNPLVERAARRHFATWNARLYNDARSRVEVNDGRYVIEHEAPYDAIICTLLLPQQEGTANIYSRDFFLAAKKRLAPRGRFCLWLPMHQLSPHLAGIVFHTFLSAFPNAVLIRGNFSHDTPTIGLIGARDLVDLSDTFLRARLSSLAGKAPVQQSVFFRSASNARLCLVGDLRAVATDFATDAETTDDHPVFAFDGPAPTTATELLRGFRLLEFVGKRFREPDFPSCLVPDGEKPDLLQHVRAANFLYAAGVSLNYPAKDEGERRRLFDAAQKEAATAYNLCPDLDLKRDDLGR